MRPRFFPLTTGSLVLDRFQLCFQCQRRALQSLPILHLRSISSAARKLQQAPQGSPQDAPPNPKADTSNRKTDIINSITGPSKPSKPTSTSSIPTPSTDKTQTFTPQPLGRPIGFRYPPYPGENTGVGPSRSLSQRRKDAFDKEKHLERRNVLAKKMSKSYFQDFTNMKYHKGKSFLANSRIFKKEAALYFPNFRGETLDGGGEVRDTTNVLKGKISVVNVFSSAWGEAQIATFCGEKGNPELQALLKENNDVAQRVDLNVEENSAKAWILKLFRYRLRVQREKEDWGKYFVVRKGVSDTIRETIGLLNGRVGYVYLLDRDCKIRWAASGNAEGDEKETLMKGLTRLIQDAQGVKGKKAGNGNGKANTEVEEELEA